MHDICHSKEQGEQVMLLETSNLYIRSLEPNDAQTFSRMAKGGSLLDVGFDADCEEWIDQWIREAIALSKMDHPKRDYIACTVLLKKTNEIIGSVGCSFYKDLDEVGITYFIGDKYRGSGYAVESVKAYTDYFFSHYQINKLIATIREENVASWKTIEKCKFHFVEKKMYKDINDDEAQLTRFYEIVV